MEIKELKDALASATTEIKGLVDAQSAEIKANGETTAKTAKALADATARFDEMQAEIKSAKDAMDGLEAKMNRPQAGRAQVKSLGQGFVDSEEFKSYINRGARGESQAFEMKDITGGSASAGGLIPEYRNPAVFMTPDRPLFVRQLVNNAPTSGDAVTIMREKLFTNSSAPQGGQLVSKAKSDVTYESITVPVETLAHYFIASRQVLSDAPRLRAMIDQRSAYGLNLTMDAQMLYGDGTGNNFEGLFVNTGVSDVGEIAAGTTAAELGGAMLNKVRAAVTKCQQNEFYNVNGLIINPADWETIETAKSDDGHYLWVNVPMGGEQRLWRVPVVVSNAVTAGDFMLGDWTMGATLYQREGITVRASESHSDLFIKNGVAILAEERAAFGIELPKAFTKGSFAIAEA
jgi:HK97 family phage major capsid protein